MDKVSDEVPLVVGSSISSAVVSDDFNQERVRIVLSLGNSVGFRERLKLVVRISKDINLMV